MAWSLKDAYGAIQSFASDVASSIHTAVHAVAPRVAGGLLVYRSLDVQAAGANIKASAGQVYGGRVFNAAASVRYLKIYDKASTPTSSDTPLLTIPVPNSQSIDLNCTILGVQCVNGIGVRATQNLADNDNTAPSANDVILDLLYF